MGIVCDIYDGWEYYIARAEVEYHENQITAALNDAKLAQKYANTKARQAAIGIFIGKCYAAIGDFEKSSQTYRALIQEGTYLPPVIMGIMYNNLEKQKAEKVNKNITVVKIFADSDQVEHDENF